MLPPQGEGDAGSCDEGDNSAEAGEKTDSNSARIKRNKVHSYRNDNHCKISFFLLLKLLFFVSFLITFAIY